MWKFSERRFGKMKLCKPIFFSLIDQKLISKQCGQHEFTIFLFAHKTMDEIEKQFLTIGVQIFELREYTKKEGLNMIRKFVESKTAKEPSREIFNEMVTSIQKNEAKEISAWHPID